MKELKEFLMERIQIQIDASLFIKYSLRPKLYEVLSILHILRNTIKIVWKRDIMSCFTKLSLIKNMRKIMKELKEEKVINS